MNTTRTRFAPSPTGYLHIGGARTALFSWLHARKNKGQFILRIEDTDLERSTQASVDAILQGMEWLGLDYDEGPFYQTQRFDRYKQVIQNLLDQGQAYHCYCSKDELDSLRAEQMAHKQKPRYNGLCRDLSEPRAGVNPVVRFRNPDQGEVAFNDLVRGQIVVQNSELDDLIITRSDGSPTYNLTVVVDDLDMGVNHVIRGDDHINNTPRQINILKAIGAEPPHYAHVPMILGADGARLSKRHGALGVMQYRDDGFLPEALLNYLVRLGWSHGDQEIFSLDEMIQLFDISDVNKAASTFNFEKLIWLNHHYIMHSDPSFIATHLNWHLKQQEIDTTEGPAIEKVIEVLRERSKTLVELATASTFFYKEFEDYDEKAAKKNFKAGSLEILQSLQEHYIQLTDWQAEPIHQVVLAVGEAFDVKLGKVGQPLRVAISGAGVSPPIDITLELLGKDKTLARLQRAITYIQTLTL